MEIYLNTKTILLSALALAAIFIGYTVISTFFAMVQNFLTVGALY